MMTKMFEARVVNGRLQHGESLDAFEGRQVRVTLEAAPDEGRAPVAVEHDIHVRLPFPGEPLPAARVIEGGPLRPCLVLPEDLPDEP
jgi:hypothetical protein